MVSEENGSLYRSKYHNPIEVDAWDRRLVKCQRESAGKIYGTAGKKIGNAYLRWAFGEAAVLFLRGNPNAQAWLEKKARKYNKAKALTILAHKLGRAVFYMLKRKTLFDQDKFLALS